MNAQQLDYINAKAKVDAIREMVQPLADAVVHTTDEQHAEAVESLWEAAGYYVAWAKKTEAERALLKWAQSVVRNLSQYAKHKSEVDLVLASRKPVTRQQAIDICLRLKV